MGFCGAVITATLMQCTHACLGFSWKNIGLAVFRGRTSACFSSFPQCPLRPARCLREQHPNNLVSDKETHMILPCRVLTTNLSRRGRDRSTGDASREQGREHRWRGGGDRQAGESRRQRGCRPRGRPRGHRLCAGGGSCRGFPCTARGPVGRGQRDRCVILLVCLDRWALWQVL